jgi:hypothetical protein
MEIHMPKAETNHTRPLSEPVPIQAIFCSELVKVERIGPCVRLVFAVEQTLYCGTKNESISERTIIAKLVIPADLVQGLIDGLAAPEAPRPSGPPDLRIIN